VEDGVGAGAVVALLGGAVAAMVVVVGAPAPVQAASRLLRIKPVSTV